ncbi:MAG: aminotransferase class I/II-fold pyridoxal phosphate-dependent enzyme [Bdellovibrionaceae bacterium]|nr:aminotransferase class I/II-fold pyridoxal phosphate-dependent enzyme [Pseudobdellovibrionaceae bacterium]
MKLSHRVADLKPSVGFELLNIANQMKEQGEDVVSLAIGELQWKTYLPIRRAGQKAIEEGYTKYSPSAGQKALRKKLAQQASQQFSIPFDCENVFISNGCKYVLYVLFQSLCDKGDEVLLPAPYWMSYPPLINFSGASLKVVPTQAEQSFKITPEELEKNINHNTKVFLLNSPNNPTSVIYTQKELKALGEILKRYPHVITVVDSIYDRLVFEGKYAPHLLNVQPDLRDRILAVSGASKNYLMTGWRLGWLFGPKELVKVFSSFQSQTVSCANSIVQRAFEQSFEECEEDIKEIIQKLIKSRNILLEKLDRVSSLKLFPSEGAFYLWLGVKAFIGKKYKGRILHSSKDIMEELLKDKKLLCICGEEFGMPGYIRLSYVAEEDAIKKAAVRLQEFFSEI